MMQEERQVTFDRGKVSAYNGQDNLFCDFATVVQGGKQEVYYLLNDKKLDNGCFIASTVLKEAIDSSIPRAHLGLINKNGDVIIPFENKTIKIIDDKYLLVVRTEAHTQTVLDAIASRSDPTAAERMVNSNASIKEKLNKVMKNTGKFILNDLLSEGTVYTLDGKNLLDNQYYSFIGMTDDSFYCSTNVPTDSVFEYPFNAPVKSASLMGNNVEKTVEEVITPDVAPQTNSLDVSNVSVPKETIDNALNSAVTVAPDNSIGNNQENEPLSLDAKENIKNLENSGTIPSDENHEEEIISVEENKNIVPSVQTSEITPLPEVEPDSIFESTTSVDDKKETQGIDTTDINQSSMIDKEEASIGNIVEAVGGIVKENKELKSLKEKYESQLQHFEEVEKENQNLALEVTRLKEENQTLRQTNLHMVQGFEEMKKVLAISDSSTEDVSRFQKVA